MNLRDLIYILAVAKHGQFSKAAIACNVSQPALSNQIKKLEHKLGGDLFFRHATQVNLTELGARILPIAQRIVDDANTITDVASALRDPTEEPLRIGMVPTLAPFLTSYLANFFERTYPEMRIPIIEALSNDLCDKLIERELDIAFAPQAGHMSPLEFTPIWTEGLLFAAREGHPLLNRAGVYPDIIPSSEFTRVAYSLGFEIEQDLPPISNEALDKQIDVSALRFETVCRLIANSDDCTVVTGLAAEQFKQEGLPLGFTPFSGSGATRSLGALTRANFPRQSVLDRFCAHAHAHPPKGVTPIGD